MSTFTNFKTLFLPEYNYYNLNALKLNHFQLEPSLYTLREYMTDMYTYVCMLHLSMWKIQKIHSYKGYNTE